LRARQLKNTLDRAIAATHRDRVLLWMPARVKNLLAKVDVLGLKPFLLARHFASRPANLLRLESGLVGLQHDVIVPIDVVDAKVVVIRAGQDVASSVSF
jgi:hypothetical protein